MIEIVDEQEGAVSGAEFCAELRQSKLLRPLERGVLATSDVAGAIQLAVDQLEDQREACDFVIRHPDFCPALIAIPEIPGSQRVQLQRGARLCFEFRTSDGAPISGARAAISGVSIPRERLGDELAGTVSAVGGVPFRAADSGEHGRIEFHGLAPGTYFVHLDHPFSLVHADLSNDESEGGALDLGAGEVRTIACTVLPLMAVAFVVVGDEVLYCGHVHKRDSRESGFFAESSIGRAASALRQKLGGQGVNVCVRLAVGSTDSPTTEKWFLDLARSGERTIDVPFRVASGIEAPMRLDFSDAPPADSDLARLTIRVRDSRGRQLEGASLVLMPQRKLHRARTLLSGESVRIRPGEYRVSFDRQPWLRDRLRVDPIDVEPGATREIDLQILEPASRLRISAQRMDGLPIGHASLSIECSTGYRTELRGLSSSEPLSIWLPESLAKLRARSAGLTDQAFEVLLDERPEAQLLQVIW